MHTYSLGGDKENIRRTVMLWLFCLSVIFCTLGNQLIGWMNTKLPDLFAGLNGFFAQWPWMGISIGAISAFAVYGFLFWLFDKFIWKIGIVEKWTGIMNFSGEWKGLLISSYRNPDTGKNAEIDMVVTIKQTWTKISVHCEFTNAITGEQSRSSSEIACVNPEYDGATSLLTFTYRNRSHQAGMAGQDHRGTNDLFLQHYKRNSLNGDYYNRRGDSANFGNITLSR